MKLKNSLGDSTKQCVKLWKNDIVLTNGLIWMLVSPMIENLKYLKPTINFARRTSENPPTTNLSCDCDARYRVVLGKWVLEEHQETLCIFDSTEMKQGSEEGTPVFKAKQGQDYERSPGFIVVSNFKYLVPDMQNYPIFQLLDLSAESSDTLVELSLKSPNSGLETYSCSDSLLAWMTSGSSSRAQQDGQPSASKGILVHSVSLATPNQPMRASNLEELTKPLEPEFITALTSKENQSLPPQIFVHRQRIAVVTSLAVSDVAHRYMLCFMVLSDTSSGPEPHSVMAHTTHNLDVTSNLSGCTWFGTTHIHALYLAKDTSGFLFRHTQRKVILLSRWPRLQELCKVWPDTKTNQIQLRWSRIKKCFLATNRNYIDWSREGDVTYFELRI